MPCKPRMLNIRKLRTQLYCDATSLLGAPVLLHVQCLSVHDCETQIDANNDTLRVLPLDFYLSIREGASDVVMI